VPLGEVSVLLERAACDVAVLIAREGSELELGPDRPVLVPFGGAEHDWAALELGSWLASSTGAPLKLLGAAGQSDEGKSVTRMLADARDVMSDLGVHFETSASEATAAATLSASVMYPIRGAVTFKSTAGANVAADALSNLASSGVTGGALIVIGEDYGEGSSIMQERSHAFAMKSQMWLLDPRPNLECVVKSVEDGFELSEASNTPVMLEIRIRACHVHGRFIAKNNKKPSFSLREALENPRRDTERVVLPPASYRNRLTRLVSCFPPNSACHSSSKSRSTARGRARCSRAFRCRWRRSWPSAWAARTPSGRCRRRWRWAPTGSCC